MVSASSLQRTARLDQPVQDAGTAQGLLLAFVPALVNLNGTVVFPIIPKLHEAFATTPNSRVLVSMVAAMPLLGTAITCFVIGAIGERVNRRRLLVAGTAVYLVMATLPYVLQSLAALLVARAMSGAALGAMTTSSVVLIGAYFAGAARERWLAIGVAIASVVSMAAAVIVGALGEINWRLLFLLPLIAAPYLVALLMFSIPIGRYAVEPSAGPLEAGERAAPFPWPVIAIVFLLTVLACLIVYAPLFVVGLIYQEKHLGGSVLTGVTTALLGVGSVAGALGGTAMKRLPPALKIAVVFGFTAVAVWLIAAGASAPWIIARCVLSGVAQGIAAPTFLAGFWMPPPSGRGDERSASTQ